MPDPLPRQSLSQRTARWLLDAISAGEWSETLPGERGLCQRLEVSRPVLREALLYLAQQGVIVCEPNHPRRIVSPKARDGRGKKTVRFVVGSEALMERNYNEPLIALTSENLAKHEIKTGVGTEAATRPLLEKGELSPDTQWVLVSVSEATQRAFFERGVPAIVAGSTFPGVAYPSVDIDHRAAARHAVGRLLQLGHRRLGLIIPDQPRAGDLETEEGFRDGVGQSRRKEIETTVLRCRAVPEELARRFRRLLSGKNRPTAILCARAHWSLTILTLAQREGLRVPEDLSLVSRDHMSYLAYVQPGIASYEQCQATHARWLTRMILEPPSTPVVRRLLPEFVEGGSLAKAPEVT